MRIVTQQGMLFSRDIMQLINGVGTGQYPIGIGLGDNEVINATARGIPIQAVPGDALQEVPYGRGLRGATQGARPGAGRGDHQLPQVRPGLVIPSGARG